ncbi:nodulation S family protein [Acidiphilium sp. PA]|uniref:class I SAM-dependent DNA methyltransferase n=1 Tax=Acidiphilium sp. PA TaxID=2871705 RepID=UPI002244A854|nr:SAM-dependent methyltransferase [Acidiphilium sp. PA]MCW8306034.1 nodulation S family protein [Acidiphilium sp. PA]
MTASPSRSRDAGYFAALYDANPDPWNFEGSAYELRKYRATLSALGGQQFNRALEVGCSIGVLTSLLAPRCVSLFAVDIVESALAAARVRCAAMAQVEFALLRVPEEWPAGQVFDLILLSEVLYFLTPADIGRVAAHVTNALAPGGSVVLVNYTEQIDEPCSGDQAADVFIAATQAQLRVGLHERHQAFRIDRLQPCGSTRD